MLHNDPEHKRFRKLPTVQSAHSTTLPEVLKAVGLNGFSNKIHLVRQDFPVLYFFRSDKTLLNVKNMRKKFQNITVVYIA